MKEEQYVNRIYENAMCNPNVNTLEPEEIEAEMRELSEMLLLDPDVVINIAEGRFPEVTSSDFTKASNLTI